MRKIETLTVKKRILNGFTLIELTIVISVLAIIAALATVRFSAKTKEIKIQAADVDLNSLRTALIGTDVAPGYIGDMSQIPGFAPAFLRVHNLLCRTNVVAVRNQNDGRHFLLDTTPNGQSQHCAPFVVFTNRNNEAERGWRGPYIKTGSFVKNTNAGMVGLFPHPGDKRTDTDETFESRNFFPYAKISDFDSADLDNDSFVCYGIPGEQALGDPWGNPYVLQIPPNNAFNMGNRTEAIRFKYARFISAGPDGIIQTPCYFSAWSSANKESARLAGRDEYGAKQRGDDIVLFVNREDIYEEAE